MPLQDSNWLAEAVRKALRKEIETIIEVEAKEATRRVEKTVRERVGQITTAVLSKFAMHSMGQKLIIEVDFNGGERDDSQGFPGTR